MILKIKAKKQPELDDIRVVTRFAFLPIRFSDDEVIWLQFYKKYQRYSEVHSYPNTGTAVYEYYCKWEDLYDDAGYLMMKLR